MSKKITSRTNRGEFMRAEYGSRASGKCAQCCNHQTGSFKEGTVCIAFGDVPFFDCSWRPDTDACGLFNVPFKSLRPRRMPLIEVYGPTAPEANPQSDQLGLFGEKAGGIHELLY